MLLKKPAAIIIPHTIADNLQYDNKIMVKIDIRYPSAVVPQNMEAAKKISTYYQKLSDDYYKYAKTKIFEDAKQTYEYDKSNGYPFNPFEVLQTFTVTYNIDPFLSIYLERYEYTGGAHGNTVRIADTFNVQTGRKMKLSDFFTGFEYQNIIYTQVLRQIEAQQKENPGMYFDTYPTDVFKYFDSKNYYLTQKGLAVFYPLYTIAPYVTGIATFIIPYDAFGKSLKYPLER